MSDYKKTDEVHFTQGYRHEALKEAIQMVKDSGRAAELVICRDIPGHHTGGDDCFCNPKIIQIHPEEV